MSADRPVFAAVLVFVGVAACEQPDTPPSTESREQSLVFIGGATFRMGNDEAELETIAEAIGLSSVRPLVSEIPSHETTVDDYYVDKFAVTN